MVDSVLAPPSHSLRLTNSPYAWDSFPIIKMPGLVELVSQIQMIPFAQNVAQNTASRATSIAMSGSIQASSKQQTKENFHESLIRKVSAIIEEMTNGIGHLYGSDNF